MRTYKETTTDLAELRRGVPFTWGKILQWYEFDVYAIAKVEKQAAGQSEPEISYHIWIDGVDTGTASYSLDAAIISAVARKNKNSEATYWICKMLELS